MIGIFNTGDEQITLSKPENVLLQQFMQEEEEIIVIDKKGFVIAKVDQEDTIEKE